MLYADIILPLPLEGCFTYGVPEAWTHLLRVRQRVLVPLGKSKRLVGIVLHIHQNPPEGVEVKMLASMPDDSPIVTEAQLRFWQWIADYYMAPLGDVMKAALPAGLKAIDGYRPKTETHIRLAQRFRSEQAQHFALDMLQRAQGQRHVLETFLYLSAEQKTVSKTLLLNQSQAGQPIVTALVKRGILETYEVEVGRLNQQAPPHPERIQALSQAQQEAKAQIETLWKEKKVVLLNGVTGSGKTEIYIHLIQQEIDAGRQVLYLLPEIALTVQMMDRLRRVFGQRLGIYHSRYSDEERTEIWQKQLSDQPYDIILGARSALFLPMQRLGMVIVDEEHEQSFKQQDPAPRYHARSAAIVLAQMQGARTLLGTATPSIETYHNAMTGKFGLVKLEQRYAGMLMPQVQIVDTRRLQKRREMTGLFSPTLLALLRQTLQQGDQALLFQNRRGYTPMLECKTCGWVPRCPNCDVSLTLHQRTNHLTCHYCGHVETLPKVCPSCGEQHFAMRGYGTERIEQQLAELIPEANIARMDLDTTRAKDAYENIITDFATGKTNILIGTQMITKGLDFDRVALVGILQADTMMNVPDFRAHEQAYQMMTQVSGRAGRKRRRGLVLLQTRQPEEPLLQWVKEGDYQTLYSQLLAERRDFFYPPFSHLIYIYMRHRDERIADSAALEYASRLRQALGTRVLGPDKPPVARVKQMAIRKIVVKLELSLNQQQAKLFLRTALNAQMKDRRYASLLTHFDVDPA